MFRRILTGLLITASVAFPVPTFAAPSLHVNGTFAGIGTEVRLDGFKANTTLALTLTSPSGADIQVPAAVNPAGVASVMISGDTLQEAGTFTAAVHSAAGLQAAATFVVLPATIDAEMSEISAQVLSTREAEVTVSLRDRFANPLPNRPVLLISSRSDDRIQAITNQTDGHGEQKFLLQVARPGMTALSALDLLSSTVLAGRGNVTLGGAVGGEAMNALSASLVPRAYAQENAVSSFSITVPKTVPESEPFSLQITAVDSAGAIVPTYEGSVYISAPSDPDANLPGAITSDRDGFGKVKFFLQGQGRMDLPLAMWFESAGEQEIVVEDAVTSSVRGTAKVTVTPSTGSTDNKQIRILSPKGTVNSGIATITGIAGAFSNLVIEGGQDIVMAETNSNGEFTAMVRIPEGVTRVTLTIRDEGGNLKSASVTLTVDASAPSAGNASLSPSTASAESSVLATVQVTGDEADVASITIDIVSQTLLLTQNPVNKTLYQTNFAAPSEVGAYTVTFRVRDRAGNTSTSAKELIVTEKRLSKIENLRATTEPGGVRLTWNPSKDDIDGYTILIASPESVGPRGEPIFDKSLPIAGTVTTAIVEGLNAGKPYAFAIVARRGADEGPQSLSVTATPTGLSVTVVPGETDIQLRFEFEDAPPLLGYFIEYGLSETSKTERRQVAPVETVRISDLLPRTYYFTVTPIDVTAHRMEAISVSLSATPLGTDGFHGAAGDPVEVDPNYPIPPSNAGTGIPPLAWWAALACTVLFYSIHRRRQKRFKRTQNFLQMMDTRYAR